MANLGNLWFSLLLKDETQKDIEAVTKRLDKLNAKLKLGIDEGTLRQNVQRVLDKQTYKAKVDVVVQSASVQEAVRQAFAKAGVGGATTTASDVRYQRVLEIRERMAQRAAIAQEKLAQAQARAEGTTKTQTSSSERLNTTLRTQSSILTTLGNQIGTVFSVYSLQRFAMSLINIGGEFQKQRIALRAMLGDAQKADKIFSQMRGLAVESPFTFLELASYTKQLEAFSIPYDELYDTTKRLADISAGLGVPMERIILAYGQVRAASFLRGQEVRQFTEAGIPLLEKLAEKFSILEDRAVSVGEVFNYISRRKVPFEMVKDVLWDLTDEGGQFYNMQAELVESLSGKWGKLRDTMQMMFSDMADANNNIIGGALDGLIALVNRWRDVANVMGPVIAALGSYRAALAASVVLENASATAKRLNAIAGKDVTAATILCTNATKGLGKAFSAISAHPWVLLISAIATVGTVIYNACQNATKLDREVTKAIADSYGTFSKERNAFEDLVAQLGNAVVGTQNYNEIREKIESRYGQYLGNLDKERDLYEQLKDKIDDVTAALKARYAEEGRQAAIQKVYDDNNKKISDDFDKLTERLQEGLNLTKERATILAGALKEMIEAGNVEGLIGDYETLSTTLKTVAKQIGINIDNIDLTTLSSTAQGGLSGWIMGTGPKGSTTKISESLKKMNKDQNGLNKELEDAQIRSEAFYGSSANWAEELDAIEKRYAYKIKNEATSNEERLELQREMYDEQIKYLESLNQEEWVLRKIAELQSKRASVGQTVNVNEDTGTNVKDVKGDPTADMWKERIDLMKEAEKTYNEWVKTYGAEETTERMRNDVRFTSLGENFDYANVREELENYLKEIEQLATTDTQKKVVKSLQSAVIGFKYDEDKEALEKALKNIEKQVSETVKKWDLYNKILEGTSDENLAVQLAFGGGVRSESLSAELEQMLSEALKGTQFSLADVLSFDDKRFEEEGLKSLQPWVKAYNDEQTKMEKKQLETLLEMVKNYRDYATKVREIEIKLANDIDAIEKNRDTYTAAGLDADALIGQRRNAAARETASLNFQTFRESDEYTKVFDDLDKIGTRSINSLLEKMKELKAAAGRDLPVNEFRELVRQMNKLEEEQIGRNPFQGFMGNVKEWVSSIKALAEARREYAAAESEEAAAQRAVDAVKAAYEENGISKEDESDTNVTVTYKGVDGEDVTTTLSLVKAQKELSKATAKTERASDNLSDSEDDESEKGALLGKTLAELKKYIDAAKEAVNDLGDMFDALGMDGASEELDGVNLGLDAMSGLADAAMSYMSGDYLGAAMSALSSISGLISGIAQLHDDKLNKAIEKSEARVDRLSAAYDQMGSAAERALGGAAAATERAAAAYAVLAKQVEATGSSLTSTYSSLYNVLSGDSNILVQIGDNLSKVVKKDSKNQTLLSAAISSYNEAKAALDAVGYNYTGSNSVYMAQYASLVAQRAELEAQLAAEEAKKKTDSSKIADYQDQLYELNEELAYFVQDLVADLYDIDFDDWASQLSSSLMDAFRNGENAAEAFRSTASDILADVAEDMMRIGILEPMMQELQDALFGTQDSSGNFTGGIIDLNDLEGTMYTGMEYIADWFNREGKSIVEAMENGYEYLDELTGGILSDTGSNSGLSNSIAGVTEETADLLASYLNAIRADVSVIRMLEENFFGDDFYQLNVIAQAQLTQLNAIAANTERNAEYAGELRDMMNDVINGTKRISVK